MDTFGHVTYKQLNLASLINIEKCAEAIKAEEKRIDLLVLNAGYLYHGNITGLVHLLKLLLKLALKLCQI